MNAIPQAPVTIDVVRDYHERTKHKPQRFAAGPDTLDWDAQPNPFRRWAGAPLRPLPLVADQLDTPWGALSQPGQVQAHPLSLPAIAAFFELSFGLTAWKQFGPDRWALRANPSSGNLHPTEAYLLTAGVPDLADGLYHYAPKEHALEQRAPLTAGLSLGAPQLWIGLSSIQWREAWKYGERAFRYCQLDAGHAVGAVRYAAAALGWEARVVAHLPHDELAHLLGLDRDADFGPAEREEPELLIRIGPALPDGLRAPLGWTDHGAWQGQANRLDRHPMYRWPVIDAVAQATRRAADTGAAPSPVGGRLGWGRVVAVGTTAPPPLPSPSGGGSLVLPSPSGGEDLVLPSPSGGEDLVLPSPRVETNPVLAYAATVIRQRRSAQHFDRRAVMPGDAFLRMAHALLPQDAPPWDAWPLPARVHAVLYLHRVDGFTPGAYVLPRSTEGLAVLQQALHTDQNWAPAAEGLPLWRIAEHPALAGTLRTLSCHQAIGSDACFALSLLAEFDPVLDADPSTYRELYQEAGLIGQALYLQAEAEGLRGTGIGCYFDDAVHELLGLQDQRLQVLYHFTVGAPLQDERISTEPPYAGRAPVDLLPTP